jgi:hypothetical protein
MIPFILLAKERIINVSYVYGGQFLNKHCWEGYDNQQSTDVLSKYHSHRTNLDVYGPYI